MSSGLSFNTSLTWADRTVLTILEDDIASWSSAATQREAGGPATVQGGKLRSSLSTRKDISPAGLEKRRDGEETEQLRAANNPQHWREHPVSFLEQKETYIKEGTFVLHNTDYLMITVRLLMKDYEALAKFIVPMDDQISLTMHGRVELLKKLTTKFTAEQIREKYPIYASRHRSDPRKS